MDKSVVEDSKIRCKVKKERFDDEIKASLFLYN